jgi:Flp pilus assembly protein protease CpaA
MSNTLPLIVVAAAAVMAAAIDVRTRRVPNVLTGAIALVGVGLAGAGLGRVGVMLSIAGCVVGLVLMLPGYLIGATGGGDVKLLASVGTLLGPAPTLRAFVASAIAGGLIAVFVAYRRGRLAATFAGTAALMTSAGTRIDEIGGAQRNNRFAYAPAIAIGAIVGALT